MWAIETQPTNTDKVIDVADASFQFATLTVLVRTMLAALKNKMNC